MDPSASKRNVYRLLVVAGALGAGAPAFFEFFRVWPEIAAPAYFVSRGWQLYENVLFPHTPLLILLTAALGKVFGFSSLLFRGIAGLSMAVCGALIVCGVRRNSHSGSAHVAGLIVGVPLYVLWTIYADGPTLWPEPFIAPFLVAAALALERFEGTGQKSWIIGAGFLLGLAVLLKQTAAWVVIAGVLWVAIGSRRRSPSALLTLAAASALPYLAFVAFWALAFGTMSHVRWTLVVPLFSGLAREIRTGISPDDLHEALAMFAIVPAAFLLTRALPAESALRSPIALLALGVGGMAWPRPGLLHLSAACGLVSLLAARSVLTIWDVLRTWSRRSGALLELGSFALGSALTATHLGVALLGGGSFALDGLGGPAYYWSDPATAEVTAEARSRLAAGEAFLNFSRAHENLYALTGTTIPGATYANSTFWYVLNKYGTERRILSALSGQPGTLVLFSEPSDDDADIVRRSELYRFLIRRTEIVGKAGGGAVWRRVR